ncbi:hypothetical protein [Xanthomonas arboricola]|uniref:hypothetical protein n=1 Tax=Xanthomonas arboricola TaxID=56448 RepID=UPI0016A87487|nr:hypothetical protein [Xanthomonas arboricola]NJB94317.1 hypothetical protein [Xanthomonas arboricola]
MPMQQCNSEGDSQTLRRARGKQNRCWRAAIADRAAMALLAKELGAAAWSLVTRVAMRAGAVFFELPLVFTDSRSTNLKKPKQPHPAITHFE